MVAKIKTGRSILGAINYNEHKVRLGKAKLVMAQGYLKEPGNLSFSEKIDRLTDLTRRNERTKVNSLHVSLNFAVGENLSNDILKQIADEYMEGLGFGRQPYLVYQHFDAGHPHLHIVSTNIQPDGNRISFHLLANRASEQARKDVEKNFGLVKAEEQVKDQKAQTAISLEQVNYGKSETKRAITNVVDSVLRKYKFTSIPEFNAVLKSYNVTADRGAKESRMYAKNGLVYWALDSKGDKIGVPIKASSIYGRPTMKKVAEKFPLNELLRKAHKDQLKAKIHKQLNNTNSIGAFQLNLKADQVDVLFRRNEDGRLYGVTFVDHNMKTVFNGSDLGKDYSANSLAQYFAQGNFVKQFDDLIPLKNAGGSGLPVSNGFDNYSAEVNSLILDALFQEEKQDLAAIGKLQQRKRKKKNRGHSL